MDLTPKQQASEAIRQAETILILTGAHPSVDQAAAVIGLAAILRKFGKKVSAVMSDGLPSAVAALDTAVVERQVGGLRDFVLKLDVTKAEVDKLRYEVADGKLNIFITPFKGGFAPSDVTFDYGQPSFEYDLAIVLGVPTRARIDRAYEQNLALFEQIPLVNLDFHRSNEGYGAVNLIDSNASSLCEMLVATSESLQSGLIDAEIGTTFLMGIMAATDRFTASHTTSKSLTVAAQMMAAGGRQPAVVKALYRDGRGGERNDRGGERAASGGNAHTNDRQGGGDRNRGSQGQGGRSGGQADGARDGGASSGGGSNAGGQRTEAPRPSANRTELSDAPRAPRTVNTAAPVAPAASAPTTAVAPAAPTQEAAAPVWRDAPRRELPIIDPGHIELSEPPQQPGDPEQSTAFVPAPVEAQPVVNLEQPQTPSSALEARPVAADFAAAAEVLAQRQSDGAAEPSQSQAV